MPKRAKEKSALAIKQLRHSGKSELPERHFVGGVPSLMIQVSPNEAKSWVLRATIGNRRPFLGLGAYPEVGLAAAREKAASMREEIRQGLDPRAEKRKRKAALQNIVTFDQILEEFLKAKLADKGAKSQHQWRFTLKQYASPILGTLSVEDIEVTHILKILEPVWEAKTETAARLRGRIESVLSFAIATKRRKNADNPAVWKANLDQILPSPKKIKKVTSHGALQIADVQKWFATLQKNRCISAKALQFTTLTAARSGEVRGATWEEIDFERKIWIIPAVRMKMRREHRVPLTNQAIELLQSLPRFEDSPHTTLHLMAH